MTRVAGTSNFTPIAVERCSGQRSRDPIYETEAVPILEARVLRGRTSAAVFFAGWGEVREVLGVGFETVTGLLDGRNLPGCPVIF